MSPLSFKKLWNISGDLEKPNVYAGPWIFPEMTWKSSTQLTLLTWPWGFVQAVSDG